MEKIEAFLSFKLRIFQKLLKPNFFFKKKIKDYCEILNPQKLKAFQFKRESSKAFKFRRKSFKSFKIISLDSNMN